jgi:hypothetical protein
MRAHIYGPEQAYSSSCDLVLRVDRCLGLSPLCCRDFEAGAADSFFVTLRTFRAIPRVLRFIGVSTFDAFFDS